MFAMLVTEIGKPLQPGEAPALTPGPGEALIEVEACGVNFADLLMRDGKYQERRDPPFAPGMEAAGRIVALGEGATGRAEAGGGLAVGDRVVALGRGAMAEEMIAKIGLCAKIPDGVSMAEAAAMPIAYGTSHIALARRADLKPGERLLVLGAAGGVGLTAVEIGALMGAEVIAGARGQERLAIARAHGAKHLIDTDATEDLKAAVKALGGADVVYDPVGGALGEAAFRATNQGGRVLPIGFAAGGPPVYPSNIVMVKNLTIIGLYWGAHVNAHPADFGFTLRACFDWRREGRLEPLISDILPLREANEALRLLAERKAKGKVVLTAER
ncbi:MAG: NADPH:quinone oxidoreductase family protein [Pseudomonadota bacterium]